MKSFRQQQRPKKSSLIYGQAMLLSALNENAALERIYMDNKARGEIIEQIKALAASQKIPVNFVPVAKLNSYNVTGHEGVVALKSRIIYQEVQDIISITLDNAEAPLFLILDGITDIRNIGGIARTALCTGVHAIIIPDKGVGTLNEDAILTSAGALEKIPVCRVNSLMKTVDELHLNGIKVYAADSSAEADIAHVDFREPVAIIMGSEEKGIYPALLKICDKKIRIPMIGNFESLNVSVATGMILYEAMRQRIS